MEKVIRGQKIIYDGRKVDSYDPPMERLFRILGKQKRSKKIKKINTWELKTVGENKNEY